MNENNDKELYLNFDEYIRQGEPQKKERADAWSVAIGLQAVDGLKTSEYLNDMARRNKVLGKHRVSCRHAIKYHKIIAGSR